MKVKLLENKNIFETKWDNFVLQSSEGSLFHTTAWRDVIKTTFQFKDYYLYLVDEDDNIKSILPLFFKKNIFFGKSLVSTTGANYGGICGGDKNAKHILLQKAIELCNKLNCDFLEFRNLYPIHDTESNLKNLQDYSTFVLQLNNINLKELSKSVRKNIRKSEKSNFKFSIGKIEFLDDFFVIFRKNMQRLGSPCYPISFFKNIFKFFNNSVYIAIVTTKENEPIAADFMIKYKNILHSLFAGSYKKYNKFGVNYFIIWNSILKAKEMGCSLYDFGRSIIGSGTYNFKTHWTDNIIILNYYYYLQNTDEIPNRNPEKGYYRFLRKIWKRIPLFISYPIGTRIIKYIH